MAWMTENRRTSVIERGRALPDRDAEGGPGRQVFPPPSEQAGGGAAVRHAIQHEHGWYPRAGDGGARACPRDRPADVMDTATFYEEYWLKPKGQYLVELRSLSCEICDSEALTERSHRKLGIGVGETTDDGRFTLVELECLGSCGTTRWRHNEMPARKPDAGQARRAHRHPPGRSARLP